MIQRIASSISLKLVVVLVVTMGLVLSAAGLVLSRHQAETQRAALQSQVRTLVLTGAREMEGTLAEAIASGRLTETQAFQNLDVPLSDADPSGRRPAYDEVLEERIARVRDAFAENRNVSYAVLVDRNGRRPFFQAHEPGPATGKNEGDRLGTPGRRPSPGSADRAAAPGPREVRVRTLDQEGGETVWEGSTPVSVGGRHWGTFRVAVSAAETEAAIAGLRASVAAAMVLVLATAALTVYLAARRMTRPLKELRSTIERVAEEQTEETIEVRSADEIGQLTAAFNKMSQLIVRNLKGEVERSSHLIAGVKDAIQQISGSARELMSISNQQSAGASQQSAAVQEATTTSEEIAATARQVADNALQVEDQARQADAASGTGLQEVSDAVAGMEALRGQVQSIAAAMLELGGNSQKIGGIVDIIDEISDQTNLLALNAAIEAAGAGESGKRFAIVANEVRRLAERTVVATRQIKGLIEEIQKATDSTVVLSKEGGKGMETAGALVSRVAEALGTINARVQETTSAAQEIKLSTRQQTTASEQMAETVADVRDVAQQLAASAEETNRAIAELTDLAETLRERLEEGLQEKGRFKALEGARMMERILAETVTSGRFTVADLFDENYVPIPGTDPPKYHTRYDTFMDERIARMQDALLEDIQVVYAVLVDRNGYLPTHNGRYCQALTGDKEKDLAGNRTKRFFDGKVELTAARNTDGVLVQVYHRDTGEKMWDISAPVSLDGRHWGAFRIGYCM